MRDGWAMGQGGYDDTTALTPPLKMKEDQSPLSTAFRQLG
jgi:hypothetical protein